MTMNAKEINHRLNTSGGNIFWNAKDEAETLAFRNTFNKGINPEAVEDMRNALLKCLSYLADLNGSQWIDGDGAGEIDMRQRAKGLQQLAFDTLEKSKL